MSTDPRYFVHPRPEMIPLVPERRSRVLEVGCAEGAFLAALPGVTETWGIEPSPAAAVARTRLHRVLEATFDEAEQNLPERYFDVVICNDVIEHMPDHDLFFSRIGRYLAPGGTLVGSIPNVRHYTNLFQMVLEKDWHYRASGTLDRTHMRFFTEKSLLKCFQQHGWAVNRFQGLTVPTDKSSGRARAYYWASRFLMAATFGYFADIQYLQFAFQVTPVNGG